jgi:hypothetical protein
VHNTADETPRRETATGDLGNAPISRRRFFELGAAWAVVLAAFVAAGCGGEEEDDGDEEEED